MPKSRWTKQKQGVVASFAALASMLSLAAQAQTQPSAPLKVLRVVPQADVVVTDTLFTTAWISNIHGTMVWESLFAWDSKLQPKPQMAKDWSTSPDGLAWRFTLRDGLKFHDGQTWIGPAPIGPAPRIFRLPGPASEPRPGD